MGPEVGPGVGPEVGPEVDYRSPCEKASEPFDVIETAEEEVPVPELVVPAGPRVDVAPLVSGSRSTTQ